MTSKRPMVKNRNERPMKTWNEEMAKIVKNKAKI